MEELPLWATFQDPRDMNNISTKLCCLKLEPWKIIKHNLKLGVQSKGCLHLWERERPLLSAAMLCVTESLRFIEKFPPFSATILCRDSREWVGGTLTKSIDVKGNLVAWLKINIYDKPHFQLPLPTKDSPLFLQEGERKKGIYGSIQTICISGYVKETETDDWYFQSK